MLGVLLAVAVGWWLLRPAAAPIESSVPLASTGAPADGSSAAPAGGSALPSPSSTSTTAVELVVQAAGQVADPGVYRLPADARVDDLVQEAGGFTSKADTDRINLASPLVDGARIWVPAKGEGDPPEVVTSSPGASPAPDGAGPGTSTESGAGATPAEPVDLNTATAEQLDVLPGVGPATAAAILAYRDEHGPFTAVDDLLEVRGIGDAKLEQLRPLVRV